MKVIYSTKKVVVSIAKPSIKKNIAILPSKEIDRFSGDIHVQLFAYTCDLDENGGVILKTPIPTPKPMVRVLTKEELKSIYTTITLPDGFGGDIIDQEEYYFLEAVKSTIAQENLFGLTATNMVLKNKTV